MNWKTAVDIIKNIRGAECGLGSDNGSADFVAKLLLEEKEKK